MSALGAPRRRRAADTAETKRAADTAQTSPLKGGRRPGAGEPDTNGGDSLRARMRAQLRQNRSTFFVYVVLRAFVLVALVASLLRGHYESVFYCLLSLALFQLPMFVQANFGIELPSALEIVILLFIFAAEILGELQSYYLRVAGWDTMLHTVNGFLCAAVGFSLVDIFNRNRRFTFALSPMFMAVVAFCFSMTIGVLWEFFEYAGDQLLHMDMQKDTVVHAISSVMLNPSGENVAVTISGIEDVAVNGVPLGLGGYLDIGLHDHDEGPVCEPDRRGGVQRDRLFLREEPRPRAVCAPVYPHRAGDGGGGGGSRAGGGTGSGKSGNGGDCARRVSARRAGRKNSEFVYRFCPGGSLPPPAGGRYNE